tara:strand:- start:20635 stop:21321 length:687 start_codon:yes stop_codon:yes gene_type:complete
MALATTAAVLTAAQVATTLGTTAASFAQASKQKRAQQRAEKEAKKAIMKARKRLDVNVYEGLTVDMTPYELEKDAMLSQGKDLLQAGVEGEQRGAGTIAGKVLAAQMKGQQDINKRLSKELKDRQTTILDEEKNILEQQSKLDLAEAQGAQTAARDAEEARAQSIQQGMSGVTSLVGQAASALPLYGSPFKSGTMDPASLAQYYTAIGNPDMAAAINPPPPTNDTPIQ